MAAPFGGEVSTLADEFSHMIYVVIGVVIALFCALVLTSVMSGISNYVENVLKQSGVSPPFSFTSFMQEAGTVFEIITIAAIIGAAVAIIRYAMRERESVEVRNRETVSTPTIVQTTTSQTVSTDSPAQVIVQSLEQYRNTANVNNSEREESSEEVVLETEGEKLDYV